MSIIKRVGRSIKRAFSCFAPYHKSKPVSIPEKAGRTGLRSMSPILVGVNPRACISDGSLPLCEPQSPRAAAIATTFVPYNVNKKAPGGTGDPKKGGGSPPQSRGNSQSASPQSQTSSPNSLVVKPDIRTRRVSSQDLAPAEQLDYTKRVKINPGSSADTTHPLFDSYPGTAEGRQVTVHVVRKLGNDDFKNAVMERLQSEASSWTRAPNTFVKFIGFARVDGSPAALTQVVDGVSAKEYLKTKSVDEAKRMFTDYARILEELHCRKVVHGSIEPGCFRVDREGKPTIAGVGFIQAVQEVAKAHGLEDYRRTARYSAPETLAEGKESYMSDVYSFALVVLEIITGRKPFHTTEQEASVIAQLRRGDTPRSKDYETFLEDPWWPILRKCLARNHQERREMYKLHKMLLPAPPSETTP